ncbi:Type II secretory pathway ATPase GspE/PulE or T4P pilus assembly pathway ATPase PilB [Mariprofundus ferrinatatus]|uniref:Type II secretory pathway ATPase GspE/PulE or T4P pilus assembly pathway ATPase PilB n=1 Tax=Mariprofundus ferrinatatus TaxID=1921087 RepID=A0A2K8LC68_9PROT|nr:GspE/PulE family protein [Mariprofundus ferrinatatus]ATX82494.1 Type II secretory pathway ATPase GspE/PulE or T4P pilus assembly pathway ATPase PilB [Mariprofundus ferrinatatus]
MNKKNLQSRYQKVIIKLVNGKSLDGYLFGFSPIMTKLHYIEVDKSGEEHASKLDAQDIAYIGMQDSKDASPERPTKLLHMDELKVVTVHSESFRVMALPPATHALGFFAIGKDSDFPFQRIFFYDHGIRLQEKPDRLGDLLVDQAIVSAEDIERALKEHSQKVLPIGTILKEHGKLRDKELDHAVNLQHKSKMKLGDLLVDQDLVTITDVEQALEEQAEHQKSSKEDKPLGHILVNQGKVQRADIDSALLVQSRRRMRLGELLIEAGLITDSDLQFALEEQKVRGQRIGEILLNSQIISEDQLLSALAKKFRLPTLDLDEYEINSMASFEVGPDIIEKYQVLPIDSDHRSITIALADPMGLDAYDGISFKTGKKVNEVLVKTSQLKAHLEQMMYEEIDSDELDVEFVHQEDLEEEEPIDELEISQSAKESPIIRLVNRLIRSGLRKKASDIHILPQAKKITLAYRTNGELISENALDKSLHRQIAARIKILSGMDISEQRLPQDGRLILKEGKHTYEFRVSCIPNTFGESLVLRVLSKEVAADLDTLGLRDEDMKQLAVMSRKPFGLILVTGPTGSGKSTTLFAVLKSISDLPAHILTIEDPVESEIEGANQIQVHQKIGMTFARILRNVLRHDPDIIMIGEMRDAETAEIGIEAALTGHLMLSTLHTNSAVDTIIRLNDLGIPNYLIAPALLGIISQNLLKKLCPDCRREIDKSDPSFTMIRDLGLEEPEHLYEKVGCDNCDQSGYTGRVMLYEFLVVNEAIRQAIHDGISGGELKKIAMENGLQPKSVHALKMAAAGEIDHHDFIYSLV